jgi:hypothetical protein
MRVLFTLFISVTFLFFSACKEKNAPPPPTATSADAGGSVKLFDAKTEPINNSGMQVLIIDSDPELSATTDSDGDWVFEDLAYGTYSISFEKENYGTYKLFDLTHKNGSSFMSVVPSLGQKSGTEVSALSQSQFEQSILVNVTCSPEASPSNTVYLRYFLGLTDSISTTQYMEYSQVFSSTENPAVITLSQAQLNNSGYDSGATVYIRVYGDSYWSNSYSDPNLGQVFPNINLNSVGAISFVVP